MVSVVAIDNRIFICPDFLLADFSIEISVVKNSWWQYGASQLP